MQLAAIVLAIAALGGATLATIRLLGSPYPPKWMAIGHGAVAIAGLALLAYAAATTVLPGLAKIAGVVLLLAAAGGTTLFVGFHLRQRPLPIPIVIAHGLIAATGLGLLIAAIWQT
ncbi:MAG: hypothetical protein WD845_01850 [Pirellulales bacterium]